MLRKSKGEDLYRCPIAMYDNWSNMIILVNGSSKYEASPLKLAGFYYFDHDQVEKGLETFFKFGKGRFMHPNDRFTFNQLSHHYCDAENSMWNFTRYPMG